MRDVIAGQRVTEMLHRLGLMGEPGEEVAGAAGLRGGRGPG